MIGFFEEAGFSEPYIYSKIDVDVVMLITAFQVIEALDDK